MKHIVGFSGGIDSQACARWVLNRERPEDVILLNADAGGNEHWLTTEFVEQYSETVHPVVTVQAIVADMAGRERAEIERRGLKPTDPLDFGLLAELKKCFPTHAQQFCTTHLKLEPQKRWIAENVQGNYWRYSGVRREEGKPNDKRQGRFYTPPSAFDDFFKCEIVYPLFDWTKQMCFDYCRHHGEKTNPLYALGFDRVGCAPCVNSNKEDIRNWATRFPERIEAVRDYERRSGKTFFRPERKGDPIRFIDEVVAWSKTTRGGKQLSILADVVEPCISKYGLCE